MTVTQIDRIGFATVAVIVLVFVATMWRLQAMQAASPPLVVKGQTYAVLYSCIAQVGCYGEILTVVEIKKDGWVTMRDLHDNAVWDVNTTSVIAIQPYQPETVRAAR